MAEESVDIPHFTNANGQKIFCKYWEPETEIRALAFVIHGLGEHILRYERIAKMLTDLGFKVCGHDHIGHGKSEGVRIDVEEFSFYARDCFQHVDMMKEKHPNLPLFVVSHSMGGLINIMMANERPTEFINLLISPCLGFNPKDASPLKISGAKLLSWCWYHKQLPKISSSLISRDPAVAKDYDEDPLVFHGGPKVGFVVKMHNCIQAALQAASSVEWPYFLLHGDADQICDVGGSRTFHNSAKSKDKTLKVYEGYYHELDKEPEEYSKVILDDMREWLVSRLNGTETGEGKPETNDGKPEMDESDVKVEEQNAQEE